jgi:hypothetical protein
MDEYYQRKKQFGGGFSVTIPIGVGDSSVTLRDPYASPSGLAYDPIAPGIYGLVVQRIEMVVVTGSGGITWKVEDDNLTPTQFTGAKSAATSNTRYTWDFGAEGVQAALNNSLVLTASGAGAIGYVVIEGYNRFVVQTPQIITGTVTPDNGTAAGGTSVEMAVVPTEAGCTVTFGGVAATVTSVDEANGLVTVTTPAHAAGAVDIVVTNPSRRAPITLVAGYTFT